MNPEFAHSPARAENKSTDKTSLEARRAALSAELKELQTFGDAGEIARTEQEIREIGYQLSGIPESKWAAHTEAAEEQARKAIRNRADFISSDSKHGKRADGKTRSELIKEAIASVEHRERIEQPFDVDDVLGNVEDAAAAGEPIGSMASSEFASLSRAEREQQVEVLKQAVDQAYAKTNTAQVAKRWSVKHRTLKTARVDADGKNDTFMARAYDTLVRLWPGA